MTFERRSTSYEGLIGALVERRHQLGLTQMQVDALIGWSDGTVNKYEQPHRKWGKHLGRHSLPLLLTVLGLELVVVEKGRHVQRVVPARQFGPGDPEWLDLVRAHETGEDQEGAGGTVEQRERPVMAYDGFPVGVMSIAEVADYLGVSRNTVKSFIQRGWINAVKLGPAKQSRTVITRSSVEAMLQAGRKWSDGGARVESPPLVPDQEPA